jgi:hypothetical protein
MLISAFALILVGTSQCIENDYNQKNNTAAIINEKPTELTYKIMKILLTPQAFTI